MQVGTQFTDTLNPGETGEWFSHGWPESEHVIWHCMPVTPEPGAPQIEWDVRAEHGSASLVTYWLTVTNIGSAALTFEGRYAALS
ncbi:hypothetical protein ABT040_29955 [Streptomyces sp. NPDC002688]|uniref:hypothetical protein n=1 Tax=Streptomyces sp. NPDC002688 TaxID=3154423 RepID=UPI003321C345